MQESIDYDELLAEAFALGKKPPLKYSTKEMTMIGMLVKYYDQVKSKQEEIDRDLTYAHDISNKDLYAKSLVDVIKDIKHGKQAREEAIQL